MTIDPGHTRHDSFTLTRVFDATLREVFALFADDELWRRWFRMPGRDASYRHDFQVGGGDAAESVFSHPDGRIELLQNRATYFDIELDRRIVYSYASVVDAVTRWVSLVTVELDEVDVGTALTWTEQVAFVTPTGDGGDDLPHLRGAIQLRFNALGLALTQSDANPHPSAE